MSNTLLSAGWAKPIEPPISYTETDRARSRPLALPAPPASENLPHRDQHHRQNRLGRPMLLPMIRGHQEVVFELLHQQVQPPAPPARSASRSARRRSRSVRRGIAPIIGPMIGTSSVTPATSASSSE